MKRDLQGFFILQILAYINAILSFKFIESRPLAATVAGIGFVIMGAWMVLKTLRWENRFRYFTFFTARIYLYLFSLPMLFVRWRYAGVEFSQLQVMGIPGPVFHRWAEIFSLIVVFGTLIDWIRVRRGQAAPNSQN